MADGIERRKLKRRVKRIPAHYTSGAQSGAGHVKNLSKEGLFLRVDELPKVGHAIRVVIQAGDGSKVEVEGIVRWTTDQLPNAEAVSSGFGMIIESPSDAYRAFFEDLLVT
jgi:hypothetical protein